MARKESGIKLSSVKEAEKYKIGAVRDDVGEQLVEAGGINKEKLSLGVSGESLAKMLAAKRIDLLAYEENVVNWNLKKSNLNPGDFEVVFVLKKSELYYALHKDSDAAAVKELQQALDAVKKSAEYSAIMKKYLH